MRVLAGDCVELMREMDDASVDAVVTDPPYGIRFMGKTWDGKAIEQAAQRKTNVGSATRLTGSPDSPNRKLIARTGSAFENEAGAAGAYDFSLKGNSAFQAWCEDWATEALRVLRPGGHVLAFGGTRTYHRLACAIEDAGFEIRDCLCWLYGSGFPKSLDVSKAIDKRAEVSEETLRRIALVAEVIRTHREAKGMGRAEVSAAVVGTPSGACWNWEHHQLPSVDLWPAIKDVLSIPDKFDGLIEGDRAQFIAAEREVVGLKGYTSPRGHLNASSFGDGDRTRVDIEDTAPATDDARTWAGWGTALKPAHEPIVLARKPLTGTVAANVLEHGTGALNVDGCRVDTTDDLNGGAYAKEGTRRDDGWGMQRGEAGQYEQPSGRWPANVVLDEEAAAMLDEQTGELSVTGTRRRELSDGATGMFGVQRGTEYANDSGGASRFFYVAKASRAERNAGLEGFEESLPGQLARGGDPTKRMGRTVEEGWDGRDQRPVRNVHPTVKPIALMRWLVRLVTPPGGTVLDPFTGSGTTGIACALEGFDFIGCEQDAEYVAIAEARIAFWTEHGEDGLRIVADRERAEAEREAVSASGQLDLLAEGAA